MKTQTRIQNRHGSFRGSHGRIGGSHGRIVFDGRTILLDIQSRTIDKSYRLFEGRKEAIDLQDQQVTKQFKERFRLSQKGQFTFSVSVGQRFGITDAVQTEEGFAGPTAMTRHHFRPFGPGIDGGVWLSRECPVDKVEGSQSRILNDPLVDSVTALGQTVVGVGPESFQGPGAFQQDGFGQVFKHQLHPSFLPLAGIPIHQTNIVDESILRSVCGRRGGNGGGIGGCVSQEIREKRTGVGFEIRRQGQRYRIIVESGVDSHKDRSSRTVGSRHESPRRRDRRRCHGNPSPDHHRRQHLCSQSTGSDSGHHPGPGCGGRGSRSRTAHSGGRLLCGSHCHLLSYRRWCGG